MAYNGLGYAGSKGSRGPTVGWTYGYAYRPTDADSNVLKAKFYASSTQIYQGISIGLYPSKSTTVDSVSLFMYGGWIGPGNLALIIVSNDYEAGEYVKDRRRTSLLMDLEDTWLDVRLAINGDSTATGHYKESDSDRWIALGTVPFYDDFDNTYVRIASERKGYIDDVEYVAQDLCEPYLYADSDSDCSVGYPDLSDFALQWLSPLDFLNYGDFAGQWAFCTDPAGDCLGDLMHIDYIARDTGTGARAWAGSWPGRTCWREDRSHRGGLVGGAWEERSRSLVRLRAEGRLHLRDVLWRPAAGPTPHRARAMPVSPIRRGHRLPRHTAILGVRAGVRPGLE